MTSSSSELLESATPEACMPLLFYFFQIHDLIKSPVSKKITWVGFLSRTAEKCLIQWVTGSLPQHLLEKNQTTHQLSISLSPCPPPEARGLPGFLTHTLPPGYSRSTAACLPSDICVCCPLWCACSTARLSPPHFLVRLQDSARMGTPQEGPPWQAHLDALPSPCFSARHSCPTYVMPSCVPSPLLCSYLFPLIPWCCFFIAITRV